MLAGLRIAGGLSLIGAVVAEIAAGSAGAAVAVARRHCDLLRAVGALASRAAPLA
jgi:ABC-type nitrate/sulfonate/bicarbonate transport system permease component